MTADRTPPLVERAIRSGLWATGANLATVGIVLVRSILLARLLPVEVFGVYAFAATIVALSATVAAFGFGDALVHRASETRDAERAARVHFTLILLFSVLWAALLIAGAGLFASGPLLTALVVLATTQVAAHLALTPKTLLLRRVTHRRLAVLNVATTVAGSAVALTFASAGFGLWSLLALDATVALLSLVVLYAWRPVWRPRLLWDRATVRYFLSFGGRNILGQLLNVALQRLDSLWVGAVMDQRALGFYARAQAYGLAPITLIARPLSNVVAGAFAELKGDRERLSRAAFRAAALLSRTSCLLAGLVGLLAPELIAILIGEKWLPMTDIFRGLLIAFLFNPVSQTFAQLAVAMGRPEALIKVRLLQLAVLLACLVALVPRFGLIAVALAMLLCSASGLIALVRLSRAFVDLSAARVFVPPVLALAVALSLGVAASLLAPEGMADWAVMTVKAAVFVGAYGSVLLVLEARELTGLAKLFLGHLRGQGASSLGGP